MTDDSPFAASRKAAPKKRAGGDDGVERDAHGRPRIIVDCDKCSATGQLPSEKREGKFVKCQPCKGEGKKKVSYTRVTTFIDVLEDKSNLMAWAERKVLQGCAMDPTFLKDVLTYDDSTTDGREALNRRANAAKDVAGVNEKADKGTELHLLTEMQDRGEELPLDVEPVDWLSIRAYAEATAPFSVVRMEQLVVLDEYRVAGTPDREYRLLVDIEAPDGTLLPAGTVLIGDTKTGRLDYGQLKIAMQLAIYAHAKLYNKETGERIDRGPINLDWAVVMGVPAGEGTASLHWVDVALGWEAVEVAAVVRSLRSKNSKAMIPFAVSADGDAIAAA